MVKCAKCGITPSEDHLLSFHRFPLPSMHGTLKARVWAKYCFPNSNWTSDEALLKLYKQHKMLCGNHFDDSSYTSSDRKRLNKFAIPTEAQHILSQLRMEQNNLLSKKQPEAVNKDFIESFEEQMLTPSTSQGTQEGIKDSHKAKGLLKSIDIDKVAHLTPKKQKLYKKCRQNIGEILRLRMKLRDIKKCKRNILATLTNDDSVNKLKSNLSSSFLLLLQSQLNNVHRKLRGRRWTIDDKVLALSLYKKSSACYRLLRRLFCLPSVSSLKALLNKIPLVCGINNQIVNSLKQISETRDIRDNLCTLAFDEMSIRKNLTYNSKLDQMDGYQDHGSQGRTSEIASYALTFMAIGLRKQWKQPIAFYFSGGNVTANRLSVLIKEVLKACFDGGLEVVGTVCDLDRVNIRAINLLGSTKDEPVFDYEGHQIVTILDPPHLLKCFRNNFMKYNIDYTQNIQIGGQNIKGLAKWSHIQEFYNQDKLNPNFVFAPALTNQHLQPNGKQKMKVRLAAQVLSHSVAAGIFAKVGSNGMPQEAVATAHLISMMDKLFDAVNGDSQDLKRGKVYLSNMSSTSPHLKLFSDIKKLFNTLKFVGARNSLPSQEGWLRTINAIEKLKINLYKYNIQTLSVRRLNQDPLENCFGCIRSYCGSNPNPTSSQFVAALKTSLITNLINNNKNRNCLDDNNDLLNNFKIFLEQRETNENPSIPSISDNLNIGDLEGFVIPPSSGEMQASAYVSGFIFKKIHTECSNCKRTMLADQNTESCHTFVSFKEYNENKTSLNYVQPDFCETVESAANIINNYLMKYSFQDNLKKKLNEILSKKLNTTWLKGCGDHYEINKNIIIQCTIAICLKRFSDKQNQGFVDEASKRAMKRKIQILKHI